MINPNFEEDISGWGDRRRDAGSSEDGDREDKKLEKRDMLLYYMGRAVGEGIPIARGNRDVP